jgi:hypothetical protein
MSRKLTGAQSECGACGLAFTSVHPFDQHRTGPHGNGRRCKTEGELRAAGFEPNARGFWRIPCADIAERRTRAA